MKVVLLGEGRVGKTSLISRFVNDRFDSEEASTVQASMYTKKKVSVDGQSVTLSIWDTAGQERFHALGPIYYRNANGAVLVYDTTDADTLEKVKMWIKELKAVVGESIPLVICGNKSDMERERDVEPAVADALARRENALHFNTSAKLNVNVQEAFQALARTILAQSGGGDAASSMLSSSNSSSSRAGGSSGGGGGSKKRRGLKIDESGGASEISTAEVTTATTSTTSASPYAEYDDLPVSSAGKGAAASKPPEGGDVTTRPRNKTIVLSSAKDGDSASPAAASTANSSSTDPKKKKGGCCS